MRTLIDFQDAPLFAIRVRDGSVREGALIEGPQGWGEFSPPLEATVATAARWLTAAMEPSTVGWPDPVRGWVPVAAAIPAVDPDRIAAIIARSGCRSVDITVAGQPDSLSADIERVRAARDALGPEGVIRCDAGGRWDLDAAVPAIAALDRAAGGLAFVLQPCESLGDIAAVRARVSVPIAVHADPGMVSATLVEAADVLALNCGHLGGARRALRIAERVDMPCVVTATYETSIGLAAGLALAGALPELPHACGFGALWQLDGDLVTGSRSLYPKAGGLPVAPAAAGPDPERLRQFAMIDPARITVWRSLIRAAAGAGAS